MAETLVLRGTLEGHEGWVTSIATPQNLNSDVIISASRDKTLLVWKITREEGNYGYPLRSLHGHSHFVEDVDMSSNGQFALSGSWDGTLRLWDLNTGNPTRRFIGHTKDVLSVAFSVDNRQIVSASRDKTIKLWNTLGECKYTINEGMKGHSEWVSCVRFSPVSADPTIVSGGWDKKVKVWGLETKTIVDEFSPEFLPVGKKAQMPYCTSLAWSKDGQTLYAGYTDNKIRVWCVDRV